MNKSRGLIIACSGPSGVGKGTVLAIVEKMMDEIRPGSVGHSISVTTRAPRGQEVDGVEYYFRTPEQFKQMVDEGEIVEYDNYVGNYYGTPATPLEKMIAEGKDVLFDITIEGSLALKNKFPDDTVTIFIVPPSFGELESRLRGRGTEDEAKIEGRMAQARIEVGRAGEFDYIVQNIDKDEAAVDIKEIIEAEKLKTSRQKETLQSLD